MKPKIKHSDVSDEMVKVVLTRMEYIVSTTNIGEFIERYPKVSGWDVFKSKKQINKEGGILTVMSLTEFINNLNAQRKIDPGIIDDYGIREFWESTID